MIRLVVIALVFHADPVPVAAADDELTFRTEPFKKLLVDLKDPNAMIRRMAADTLGKPDGIQQGKAGPRPKGDLYPAILALVDALKDADDTVRANAVRSIGMLFRDRGLVSKPDPRDDGVALAVIERIKDSDGMVRSRAAAALTTVPVDPKTGLARLAELLKDDTAAVRAAAAEGLRGVRPPVEAVPTLAAALGDPAAEVRLAAATTLQRFGTTSIGAVDALAVAAVDRDYPVAGAAATALAAIGPGAARAVPALCTAATDRANPNRTAALTAIGAIRGMPDLAIPVLVSALGEAGTRSTALYALANFGTTAAPALPAIHGFARDAAGSVQPEALMALSEIEPDGHATLDLILAGLRDLNPKVRGEALNVCSQLAKQVPHTTTALVVLFRVDPALRTRVAYVLGSIGPEAAEAVPALIEVANDLNESPAMRRTAMTALRRIDPDAAKAIGGK